MDILAIFQILGHAYIFVCNGTAESNDVHEYRGLAITEY